MFDNVNLEVPAFIDKALSPVAESIGNTVSSLWDITFGWIDNAGEKISYKRQANLQQFKEQLTDEISQIPTEQLIEPPLSIIGPALESSKFYFEEEHIKSMFAKLIANAMNSANKQHIHNCYVDFIKQMSSLEAIILSKLSSSKTLAIARFNMPQPDSASFIRNLPLVYFDSEQDISAIHRNAVALTNLDRLGLIEVTFSEHIAAAGSYDKYKNSPLSKCTYQRIRIGSPDGTPSENVEPEIREVECEMEKGCFRLTSLGVSFIQVCL